jgi:phosphoglucosamine mutase
VRVEQKKDMSKIPTINKQIKINEKRLNGKGRINIRYSGTEPISRVMVEGEDDTLINEIAQELAETIENELGVGT